MATKRTNGSETGFVEPDDEQPIIIGDAGEIHVADGGDEIPAIDPATIPIEFGDDEQPARRRGRKPGTKNTNSKASKQATDDLTGLLAGLSFMAGVICQVPELELDETEAAKLGKALNRLNELYSGMVMPPKVAAWLHLGITAGTIYGPRAIAYNLRKKNEKGKQPIDVKPTAVH